MIYTITCYTLAAIALLVNFSGPKILAKFKHVDKLDTAETNKIKLTAFAIAIIALIFAFTAH